MGYVQYGRPDRETLVNYELDIERIVIEDMEDDLTIRHIGTHLTLHSTHLHCPQPSNERTLVK